MVKFPAENRVWNELKRIFFQWGKNIGVLSGLLGALTTVISEWMKYNILRVIELSNEIQQDYNAQYTVRWGDDIKGLLSK